MRGLFIDNDVFACILNTGKGMYTVANAFHILFYK